MSVKTDETSRSYVFGIHQTAKEAYRVQGPGIGTGEEAIKRFPPPEKSVVLDVGFGDCKFVKGALDRDCQVFGIDFEESAWNLAEKNGYIKRGFFPIILDISHDRIPIPDNTIDWAYCLETMEHLSNPYFAVAEVKRVLKHRGKFRLTFPDPDSNLGYEGGKHAHIYPGFLQRVSFERFMMQLYFKKLDRFLNGDTAWYLFENIKEGGRIIDVFSVAACNFTEEELYGWMNDLT